MTHSYVTHDSFICVIGLFHMCDMTHSQMLVVFYHACWSLHEDGTCVTLCMPWLIHLYDTNHLCVRHDSFINVTWLIHTCDMAHVHVWHGSSICAGDVTLRMQPKPPPGHMGDTMCNLTHLYVWHDMTFSYVWHDLFTCVAWYDSFICDTWLIHMCNRIRLYVWHDSFTCVAWHD